MSVDTNEFEYAGFWIRFWAFLIDSLLVSLLLVPLLVQLSKAFGWQEKRLDLMDLAAHLTLANVLLNVVAPAIAVLVFWRYRSATPGKMAIGATIVDATTGARPSTGQLIGRYLGYYVALIPLMLGLFWVGIDPRKQGWHDKLANTVVIRRKRRAAEPVSFDG
jgi:uncharacterized RDD family membrane protein YckC